MTTAKRTPSTWTALAVAAVLALGGATLAAPATAVGATLVFLNSGDFVVPAGAKYMKVTAIGGRGGQLGVDYPGGRGGYISAYLPVAEGDSYRAEVGSHGVDGGQAVGSHGVDGGQAVGSAGRGGANGGGAAGVEPDQFGIGGGGGSSFVHDSAISSAIRLAPRDLAPSLTVEFFAAPTVTVTLDAPTIEADGISTTDVTISAAADGEEQAWHLLDLSSTDAHGNPVEGANVLGYSPDGHTFGDAIEHPGGVYSIHVIATTVVGSSLAAIVVVDGSEVVTAVFDVEQVAGPPATAPSRPQRP